MTSEQLSPKFCYPIKVRFADTDLQGHVFFGNYLTYIDEALIAYIRELDHSWDRLSKMGIGLYYVDCGYQFKGQAFVEDILNVSASVSKLGNSSVRFDMSVSRAETDELIGTGFIAAVMVDADSGKSTRIPDSFRDAVTAYQEKSD